MFPPFASPRPLPHVPVVPLPLFVPPRSSHTLRDRIGRRRRTREAGDGGGETVEVVASVKLDYPAATGRTTELEDTARRELADLVAGVRVRVGGFESFGVPFFRRPWLSSSSIMREGCRGVGEGQVSPKALFLQTLVLSPPPSPPRAATRSWPQLGCCWRRGRT